MDKLTAIKIKYDDETYSDEIPIRVLSENVEWDNTHTLVDVLGSIDVDAAGTIQDQISQLFNEKVSATQLQDYVASQLNDIGANPVVVDSSLTISGAAADAKIVGNLNRRLDLSVDGSIDYMLNHNVDILRFLTWEKGKYVSDSTGEIIEDARFYLSNPINIDDIMKNIHVILTANVIKWSTYDENGKRTGGGSYSAAIDIIRELADGSKTVRFSVGAWSGNNGLTDYLDTISVYVTPAKDVVLSDYVGYRSIPFTESTYIYTPDVGTNNVSTDKHSLSKTACFSEPCSKGDAFIVSARSTGDSGRALYMFLDSTGKCVYRSSETGTVENLVLYAPCDGTLVVNVDMNNGFSAGKGYKDLSNKILSIREFVAESDYLVFTEGYCIVTQYAGARNVSTDMVELSGSACLISSCTKGDRYTLSGTPINNSGRRPYMFLDNDGTSIYRSDVTETMDEVEIVAPIDGKLVVNFSSSEKHKVYKGIRRLANNVFENIKRLEVIENATPDAVPTYYTSAMSNRPVGPLSKGYLCLSCDDGEAELASYTIPMLIEKNVPCTFGLWASKSKLGAASPFNKSTVLQSQNGIDAVLSAISHGCAVAQHGPHPWTEVTAEFLDEFFEREKEAFTALGIEVKGAIVPYHCINDKVRVVAGGRFGAVRTGYKGFLSLADQRATIPGDVYASYNYYCTGPRSNIFGMPSFNSNAVTLDYMKNAI